MMVLFMTPCADTLDEEAHHSHDHTVEAVHYHQDHSDTNDLCTPFCVCSCCGAVSGIVLHDSLSNVGNVVDLEIATFVTYYNPVFILSYVGEIWQPPKINA